MTREEFVTELEDMLMLDEGELELEKALSDYEDWDSMGYLSLIAMFDSKLEKRLTIDAIRDFKTANDIITFAEL